MGLVGDAKATLRELIRHLRAHGSLAGGAERISRLAEARKAWDAQLEDSQQDNGKPIHPARLLSELAKAAPRDAIFVTDVGWNKNGAGQQLVAAQPRSFLTSGGMATMGFAPAVALGAAPSPAGDSPPHTPAPSACDIAPVALAPTVQIGRGMRHHLLYGLAATAGSLLLAACDDAPAPGATFAVPVKPVAVLLN